MTPPLAMELVARLEELIGPPETPPEAVDWVGLESDLGLVFPADYKALWARHPDFRVDHFWSVVHPGGESLNPSSLAREHRPFKVDDVRSLMGSAASIRVVGADGSVSEEERPPCYPEVPGLLRWGFHEDVPALMWMTDPDPERWTVVLSNYRKWWRFDGGMVEFMTGLFSGEVNCPLIPKGWRGLQVEEFQGFSDETVTVQGMTFQKEIWKLKSRWAGEER